MKNTINRYIAALSEPNHRYLSWEYCYQAFGNPDNSIDYLTLHLAFYLASWGMYRGSGTLLHKDYKIHTEIVNYVKPLALKRDSIKQLEEIEEIMNKITKIYGENGIKASITLQTKVLLGVLGYLPAFDRFFIDGWKLKNSGSRPTATAVFEFAASHTEEIEECQKMIGRNILYPPMKIVDMYFWQLGYDNFFKK